jgi:CotH kinase protein/Chitobiase/beta-hexosaminidase C-terminal domain/Lamin Tail Domain
MKNSRPGIARRWQVSALWVLFLSGSAPAAPSITEFLAANSSVHADEDGEYSDWIEIHNPDAAALNLDGYYLTDNPNRPTKWRFPALTLNPGAYVVVFASDKNRAVAGAPLHTNFKLSADGEFLGLVAPDGVTIVSQFAPAFPKQFADVSYGSGVSAGVITTESPVLTGDTARFFVPKAGEPAGDWRQPAFDDTAWATGETGLGFGYTGVPIGAGGDLTAPMRNVVHGSVYVRIPFQVANPAEVISMTLRMKVDDGFAAYLNGQPVASKNAPSPLVYDSVATAGAEVAPDDPFESHPVGFSGHLVAGTNILAIHGMNLTHGGSDFLIIPELDVRLQDLSTGLTTGYFDSPTPGGPNGTAIPGYIKDTQFSVKRGFFSAPFPLEITTETPGVQIRYTTDGSAPTESHGTVYSGPITISKTTTLQAAAFRSGYRPTNVDTQTYIFLADVQTQPVTTQLYWDTGMDPNVVNASGTWTVAQALADVPTLSIVMDPNDLFGATAGIYTHATQEAALNPFWEKECSAEYFFHPDYHGIYRHGDGFQIDCGISIGGNFSRLSHNPKHSFRLKFKEEYGKAKLEYPFYPTSPVDEYDTLSIRTGHNQGWATNIASTDMLRDQYARDIQGFDPAHSVSDGNHVHLYLNGQYWGLYFFSERPDDSWGSEHYGGHKEDYDAFRGLSRGGSTQAEIVSGNRTAWAAMFAIAARDMTDPANYQAIQQYVDIDQLIDHNIGTLYNGDLDGPTGWINGPPNSLEPKNFYGMRRRHPDGRFRFFRWDAEFIFGSTGDDVSERSGTENPAALHFSLRRNADYRRRFGDRVHKYFYNGGPFSVASHQQFYLARSAQIDKAIVAESARWGDSKREPPFTRDVHWINERNRITNVWMPGRHNVILNQFRADGLYPAVAAPVFNINAAAKHGGPIISTDSLTMTAPLGTMYYTTDGSDPRAAETPVEFTTHTLVGESAVKRAVVPTAAADELTWFSLNFDDSAWPSGTMGAGYESSSGYQTYVDPNLDFLTQVTITQNETIYLRTTFHVADPAIYDTLSLLVRYDDGFVAYLNGVEIARDRAGGVVNTPLAWNAGGPTAHDDAEAVQFVSFPVDQHLGLLRAGTNVLAVHGVNSGLSGSDFLLWPKLEAKEITSGGGGTPWSPTARAFSSAETFPDTTTVKARALHNGVWSALTEATFLVDSQPAASGNLVISEFDYHPATPTPAEEAEGCDQRKDFEFVELLNTGSATVDLAGVAFTAGILFNFNTQSVIRHLPPGQRLLVVKSREAFAFRYRNADPRRIAGEFAHRLGDEGDEIALRAANGADIVRFTYNDKHPWPKEADGDGRALVLIRPESNPNPADPSSWRASVSVPTPGSDDRSTLAAWLAARGLTDPHAVQNGYPVSNIFVYALGADIASAPADALPKPAVAAFTVNDVTANYLTVTWSRRTGADDVRIIPELSSDLATWTSGEPAATVTVSRRFNSDSTETIVVREAQPITSRRFVRLRAGTP